MGTSTRTLAERLRAERNRLKLNQAAFAEAGGASRVTQVGYEAGTSIPSVDYLARVADVGADADYILFGIPKAVRVAQEFDWAFHAEIMETVAEWAESEDRRIPPAKLSAVVRMLYEQFSAEGEIEPEFIIRTLRLVA
jgi:transcriptional regulator with XRE-family HTH domain